VFSTRNKGRSALGTSSSLRRQLLSSTAVALAALTLAGSGNAQAVEGSLKPLGTLNTVDYSSTGNAVSNNGTVVGFSYIDTTDWHAFYWTAASGMVDMGTLTGTGKSVALGLSADGDVIVGWSTVQGGALRAFRWTQPGGMVELGTLWSDSTAFSAATDTSGDGSVIAGYSSIDANTYHAFRWTQSGGMVDIGTIGNIAGNSVTSAISKDGMAITGYSDVAGGQSHAYYWTQSGGMVDLGTIGNFAGKSYGLGISGDGTTVVGYSQLAGSLDHAFRWTQGDGLVDLGSINNGGGKSYAYATNETGSVIVGRGYINGNQGRGFRWTAATGMVDLNTLLTDAGVDMTGIRVITANGISQSGEFITGNVLVANSIVDQAYLIRYVDAAVAGITSADSVQGSVDGLADAKAGVAAQMQGFAAQLLGADTAIGAGNEVGAFGSVGSAAGGVSGKVGLGNGVSLIGGLSINEETFKDVRMRHTGMAALGLRYVYSDGGAAHPFVEAGGWIAPNGSFTFSRRYANGAGQANGTGSADGSLSYLYAKAGAAYDLTTDDEAVLAAELGQSRFHTDAYSETATPGNPFNADVSSGTSKLSVAKIEAKLTHEFTPKIDTTLRVAAAHGFSASSDVTAVVAGFGTIAARAENQNWAEYGLRAGYKIAEGTTVNLFANGVSGNGGIHTENHFGIDLKFDL
jgi:probable HAF family extracellular repeat protein